MSVCPQVNVLKLLNVKASCTIPRLHLSYIEERCSSLNIPTKIYPNFIVIYEKTFTFTIFKSREVFSSRKKYNKTGQHCNIYKLKSFHYLDKVHEKLAILLNICEKTISKITIDNTTFLLQLKKKISLQRFMRENNDLCWNISRETFPGLFIKYPDCSFILFSSGSIIIVGAKTTNTVCKYIDIIQKRCLQAASNIV